LLPCVWIDVLQAFLQVMQRCGVLGFVYPGGAGRVVAQEPGRPMGLGRTNGSILKTAATIRANVFEQNQRAFRAIGAFKTANLRVARVRW